MYDIVFISSDRANADKNWKILKKRFPTAKFAQSLNDAAKKCFTRFFWTVYDDIIINENFDFSYIPDKGSQNIVHVFQNGSCYDGLCLIPRNNLPSEREFYHRFFVEKKEVEIQASVPVPYDIVFISYNELNAEKNYKKLVEKFPRTKRISGVKGIHEAHIQAAKICDTEMFWVVDADADIVKNFNFDFHIPYFDFYGKNTVYVWKSKNPVNDLTYGYGGVKLLPKTKTIKMDISRPDMTTSISDSFKAINETSNITDFNTDSFSAWRSGFRECAKLASRVIDRQDNSETLKRLETWCNKGVNRPFGIDAIKGAIAGRKFGEENKDNPTELQKINNFEWLKETFRSN